jgi:competence protein ComEA
MNLFKSLLLGASLALVSTFALAGSPVNVNSADAAQLADSLDGIGEAKAKAIVAYRTEHGPFKSADELVNVKGIGLRTIEKNREYIQLGAAKAATPAPAKAGS